MVVPFTDCKRETAARVRRVRTNTDVLQVANSFVPQAESVFAGRQVLIQGFAPLVGRQKRVEGLLLGLVEGPEDAVEVEVEGERVRVPVTAIARANLVYDWEADLRG